MSSSLRSGGRRIEATGPLRAISTIPRSTEATTGGQRADSAAQAALPVSKTSQRTKTTAMTPGVILAGQTIMLQIKKVDRAAWFCLKCGHKLQNSHDFLNQIVSLTIRAPVPRYRLAARGRSPKKLRIMISYGMPPEKPRIGSKHKHDKGRF